MTKNSSTIVFSDLLAQYRSLKSEIDDAVMNALGSGQYIRGQYLEKFEKNFSALLGVQHVIGVASGTDALHLAMRALGVGPGDEVITIPSTWISTAFAASYVGAKPVFVDIDPDTYQMDPEKLKQAITDKTKVVIPVHMYGHPSPMEEIAAICRPRGIRIVEDVAQAPLATHNDQQVGTFGDLACFSFYPSKNLGGYGDGGAVAGNDEDLIKKVRMYADYGQNSPHHHEVVGFNSRLDALQAAALSIKLPYLKKWTELRRAHAEKYTDLLKDLDVKTPTEAPGANAVYHLYVVQIGNRDDCLGHLRSQGIMAQLHYKTPIHLQPCYRDLGYQKGDFPVTEQAYDRILSLPMFPELTDQDIQTTVQALREFLRTNY